MKFLITGASGGIGFPLTRYLSKLHGKRNLQLILPPKGFYEKENKRGLVLIEEGFDVVINDILHQDLDIKAINPFDVLLHLAAFTETETDSPRVHVNDIGTERLLNALKPLLPGKRVIHTGSVATIDRSYPDNTPITENHPHKPRTVYGLTKLKAESIIKRHAKETGFEWVILRLPTVYGPSYRPGGMFDVIPKSLRKNSLSTRLSWPGRLSVVYVQDVVKVLALLSKTNSGISEIYNINSGENPTFDEMITDIARIIGVKRRTIQVPKLFWSLVRFIVWFPGLLNIMPFKLKVALWRISLIINDGFVFDSSKLNKVFHVKYTKLEKGLPTIYKKETQPI